MKDIRINILAGWLISVVLFSACSVTKHLPEGEILYTGGKRWLSINHRHGLAKQL